MKGLKSKQIKRQFRARRIRAKLKGSEQRPRLTVWRSNQHVYAQLIDDVKGVTVASASDLSLPKGGKKTKIELAKNVGLALAEKAAGIKVDKAIFDKGPYKYHGIIKSLADGAREGGLKF